MSLKHLVLVVGRRGFGFGFGQLLVTVWVTMGVPVPASSCWSPYSPLFLQVPPPSSAIPTPPSLPTTGFCSRSLGLLLSPLNTPQLEICAFFLFLIDSFAPPLRCVFSRLPIALLRAADNAPPSSWKTVLALHSKKCTKR